MTRAGKRGGLSLVDSESSDPASRRLQAYIQLLFSYLRSIRLREPRPREQIHSMVSYFADRSFTAKAVTDLHVLALRQVTSAGMPKEEREIAEDARLLLIEVLGTLSDTYRRRALRNREHE